MVAVMTHEEAKQKALSTLARLIGHVDAAQRVEFDFEAVNDIEEMPDGSLKVNRKDFNLSMRVWPK